MSQNGVVASVYVLGRTGAVDELFDFDFFEPDYTEVGHCHQDCLKMLENRLGRFRDVKDLPFPVAEGDHDDERPFILKGRVVAHPKAKDVFVCEYFKQYACLGQVPGPAAEASPAAKRPRPR